MKLIEASIAQKAEADFFFPAAKMDRNNMRLQRETQSQTLSLKRPSFRQTHFETTTSPPQGPKGSKRMEEGDGFKCCPLIGMCLPGFIGKVKPVKARRGGTEMDQYSVNNFVMSSTFSLEIFELNSGVAQGRIVRENNEDDSISSYFELPSNML